MVGVGVENIAVSAGGHGLDSQAGQIRHSVANGSLPRRRFVGAVLAQR